MIGFTKMNYFLNARMDSTHKHFLVKSIGILWDHGTTGLSQ